jgi:low temperature requirement protein LtrA
MERAIGVDLILPLILGQLELGNLEARRNHVVERRSEPRLCTAAPG